MGKATISLLALMLGMLLITIGCQSAQPSNRQLLEESYLQMSDAELLDYYQQLTARIGDPSSGGGGLGFGLGVGVGFGLGDSTAIGIGASKGPEPDYTTEALLNRRDQVRLEMARRGLEPLEEPSTLP